MSDQLRFEPRTVGAKNMPTDCCEYGVVDVNRGVEVCRVWDEEDCRRIARLLNQDDEARSKALDELARLGQEFDQ